MRTILTGRPARVPRASRASGRQHGARALPEADAHESRPLAPAAQHHAVAVLEEGARFPVGKRERLPAPVSELQERTCLIGLGPGLRARSQKIPRLEVAAVDGVMRQHVRGGPPGVAKARMRQALCRDAGGAHARTLQPYLQIDIDAPAAAYRRIIQIGKW